MLALAIDFKKGGPAMKHFYWQHRQFGPNQALQMRLQG
jgi:hypothetical protein